MRQVVISAVIQSLVFAIIASAVGVLLAEQVDLHAPIWRALAEGTSQLTALCSQAIPATIIGFIGAVILVVLYSLVFRPRLGNEIAIATEEM